MFTVLNIFGRFFELDTCYSKEDYHSYPLFNASNSSLPQLFNSFNNMSFQGETTTLIEPTEENREMLEDEKVFQTTDWDR